MRDIILAFVVYLHIGNALSYSQRCIKKSNSLVMRAESLNSKLAGLVLAVGMVVSSTSPVAIADDFSGLPSTSKQNGLRGKSGGLAAPSESGLGLFVDKSGPSLLRLALPDVDLSAREVQANLELGKLRLEQVGFSGRTPIWNAATADFSRASATLSKYADNFVSQVEPGKQSEATELLKDLASSRLPALVDAARHQEFDDTVAAQERAASSMSRVRELMVMTKVAKEGGLSFNVPPEYSRQPRLEGRATVQLTFKSKAQGARSVVVVTVDGFHAPLSSGAFVAQAATGAFDGVPLAYAEELIVGLAPPKANTALPVPLELFYRGDLAPTYGVAQDEDDGRATNTQVLPFQSFGALGMAHPPDDVDGGTGGQFFFVKYDQALMPPGRNTVDGAYTCFGYAVEGADSIKTFGTGDVLEKAVVVSGLENLRNPLKK